MERFLAGVTLRRIRRGSCSGVVDPKAAICGCLARYNEKPKPFRGTKSAEYILTRERRALDARDETRGNRSEVSDAEHLCRERPTAALAKSISKYIILKDNVAI